MARLLLIFVFSTIVIGCVPAVIVQPPPTALPTLFPTLPLATLTALPPQITEIQPTVTPLSTATRSSSSTPTVANPIAETAPNSNDPVLVGAGDIANCNLKGAAMTAQLLDKIPGTVFTLGDDAYPIGSAENFKNCYEPTWGRHKARTYPIPGNHEYVTPGARGYFDYFGERAGDPSKGYYSYDVGAWHILALNSEIDTRANSPQVNWIRADLAAHPTLCTLAMFHRPLFSSGPHGTDGSGEKTRPLWQVLYENNADLILNGHDHDYERFAPQDPQGNADPVRGIREIVVGTGGATPYVFGKIKSNSEVRRAPVLGVLKLTLHESSYSWEFVPTTFALFRDSGTDKCH